MTHDCRAPVRAAGPHARQTQRTSLDRSKFGVFYLGLTINLYLTRVTMGKHLRAAAKVVNETCCHSRRFQVTFVLHTEDFLGQRSVEVRRTGSGINLLPLKLWPCGFLSVSQLFIRRMRKIRMATTCTLIMKINRLTVPGT